ncbi:MULTISPECIES: hypothetical protein [Pseudomonas]|uniref:hypothetical protein n=1 Tax=Pseudomonas TaxID=286 RepID=UPI0009F81BD1|nr:MULTISPECIES: hypothetical protein [Pseudomonas]MCJ2375130.1 hypothetical protein [Pseudomonas sp. RGM 3321]
MRIRGQVFWAWANPFLHSRSSDFRLQDRGTINVQVRTSTTGSVGLFIGIYCPDGTMLFEESFDSRPGQTMTQASDWGMNWAKSWLDSYSSQPTGDVRRSRPRKAGVFE